MCLMDADGSNVVTLVEALAVSWVRSSRANLATSRMGHLAID